MKFITLIFVLLIGCNEYKESNILREDATVEDTFYSPSTHGSGVGFTSGGDVAFTSVSTREKWAVVFKCKHGKFVIEGSSSENESLWKKLSRGDEVTIQYKEKLVKTDAGWDLYDYDFIDANKK